MAKTGHRQRLRLNDSWKVPISLCLKLSSRSVAERPAREISPDPLWPWGSYWEWHSWLAYRLICSGTSLMSGDTPSSEEWRLPHTCLLPQISGLLGSLVLHFSKHHQNFPTSLFILPMTSAKWPRLWPKLTLLETVLFETVLPRERMLLRDCPQNWGKKGGTTTK